MSVQAFQRAKPGAAVALMITVLAAWFLAEAILQGTSYLLVPLAVFAAVIVLLQTLKDWRKGVLFFLTWMLFEDLARKYLGNNMAVYFAKDVLAAACCLSFYAARTPKRILHTRPRFVLLFACFFFWSLLEVFNPNSPSLWYGLLGLKLYFGYAPLFFLGYALIKNASDLRRFLAVNMVIAALISLLGVAQAAAGKTLLSPAELAPDIRELGSLMRTAPITGETFLRPPSVFVSDGRYGSYLLLALLLGLGATTYFFLQRLPRRKWLIGAMVLIMAAILLSAVRGTLMWAIITAGVFILAYAPEMRSKGAHLRRIGTAISATALLGISSVVFLSVYYPEALNSRVAFYRQTLLPSSSKFELTARIWDYPVSEFRKVFTFPNWPLGYGTGTCSLGAQYVTRILGAAPSGIGIESGFGNLILEMGIPGLMLWLAWSCTLLVAEWKVVHQLRGTALFPLGFIIFWFSLITLVPSMLSGLGIENFVTNAYFFLLTGVLFSLPALRYGDLPAYSDTGVREKAAGADLHRVLGKSMPLPG